ncbi:hypothetical protein GWN42_31290 [candidate division KSB1 bacterium]|nr:hypothetical protein [Phycisphaerae bacterium]NIQ92544.1 hypothetical protein [Deltaproteobacteria bacterium]NIV97154.1 hypothetical protein [candidate division KSB1 bacterium]
MTNLREYNEIYKIAGPENVITFDDMRGKFGIFPEIEYSSDGVHFGPNGKRKFDEKILEKIG